MNNTKNGIKDMLTFTQYLGEKTKSNTFRYNWKGVGKRDIADFKKVNKLKLVKDPEPLNKGMILGIKGKKLIFRYDPIRLELITDYTIIDLNRGRIK